MGWAAFLFALRCTLKYSIERITIGGGDRDGGQDVILQPPQVADVVRPADIRASAGYAAASRAQDSSDTVCLRSK